MVLISIPTITYLIQDLMHSCLGDRSKLLTNSSSNLVLIFLMKRFKTKCIVLFLHSPRNEYKIPNYSQPWSGSCLSSFIPPHSLCSSACGTTPNKPFSWYIQAFAYINPPTWHTQPPFFVWKTLTQSKRPSLSLLSGQHCSNLGFLYYIILLENYNYCFSYYFISALAAPKPNAWQIIIAQLMLVKWMNKSE